MEVRRVLDDIDRLSENASGDLTRELSGAYALLAEIHLERGEVEAAIEAYAMASVRGSADLRVQMALGQLLADAGRHLEAAAAFREAASLEPSLAVVHYNLAAVLQEAGDQIGAVEAYERTLALIPDDVQSIVNLGLLHARRGDLAAAADRLQRAVDLQPGLARAHFNLAAVHHELGNHELAAKHYGRAGQLDPVYADKVRLSGVK
jgi:tetratricopeptide (TPR) repeat protein